MPSDEIVISARNLAKSYRLFGHPGDRVKQFLSLGLKRYHREFTALRDVSFDIRRGETIGIIGRNGSGKSTLLQLVCGILKPSAGTIAVNGRVSALLELGAGFNPEFTGRENVYFQGAIMGLGRAEMEARFAAIAAFADIGEFIDQPVRTYSSGMFVRLAFAVAVHVDPDILLVDEALAVGDQVFQRKCIDHMEMLHRELGATVLLVSHNIRQVERFCSRVLLLDQGRLTFEGSANEGCNLYYQSTEQATQAGTEERGRPLAPDVFDGRVTVDNVNVGDGSAIGMHDPLTIEVELELHEDMKGLEVVAGMHTQDLIYVALSSSAQRTAPAPMPRGSHRIRIRLLDNLLRPGNYWIGLGIYDQIGRPLWRGDHVCPFAVSAKSVDITRLPTSGLLDLPFEWDFLPAGEASASRPQKG